MSRRHEVDNTEAQDIFTCFDSSIVGGVVRAAEGDLDLITESVRREVIERQRQALQEWLGKYSGLASEQIQSFTPTDFVKFLENSDNKELVNKALNDSTLQRSLQDIEQRGYKAVSGDPRSNFQPITEGMGVRPAAEQTARGVATSGRDTDGSDGQSIRSQVIKSGD